MCEAPHTTALWWRENVGWAVRHSGHWQEQHKARRAPRLLVYRSPAAAARTHTTSYTHLTAGFENTYFVIFRFRNAFLMFFSNDVKKSLAKV